MGGGHQDAPKTYSPQEQAQAQIQIDNAQAQREQQAALRAKQEKDAADLATRTRGTNQINTRYAQGQKYGQNKVQNMGYADTYGLLDQFNQALQGARNNADPMDTNFQDDFNYDDIWNKVTGTAQSAKQTELDNKFRSLTKPGWENSYFADTADDSILDSILGEQYGEAFDTIDAARARGQLSQGAFDNTLRGLDKKKLGARSTLEDMGLGVLGGYRKNLDDVSTTWGDQVTGYKLGQDVNLDDYTAQLGSTRDTLNNRMRGDIYRAVGDTSLFNTDSLMAKGGAAAGVSNNPLRNAFAVTPNPNEPERTTGTAGVF